MQGPLFVVTMTCAAVSVVLLLAAVLALARRHWLGGVAGLALALVLLTLAALAAALSLGTQGYRALTREESAALITLEPTGPQTVTARFRFPDGREASFEVAGDELYVDAHILKWHPLANLIGLHTGYELDRVAGRYTSLEDERSKPRTVLPLAHPMVYPRIYSTDLDGLRLLATFGEVGSMSTAMRGNRETSPQE